MKLLAPVLAVGLSLIVAACGGSSASNVVQPSGDQLKLSFALEVARCMRARGFPTYPDPTSPSPSSQGSGKRFEGSGIDTKSPRFQTAELNCEQQVRKALRLP